MAHESDLSMWPFIAVIGTLFSNCFRFLFRIRWRALSWQQSVAAAPVMQCAPGHGGCSTVGKLLNSFCNNRGHGKRHLAIGVLDVVHLPTSEELYRTWHYSVGLLWQSTALYWAAHWSSRIAACDSTWWLSHNAALARMGNG